MEIPGKSALITGGSSGIGLAIAAELLAAGIGNLLLVDVNPPEEGSRILEDPRVKFHLADVTDFQELREAFESLPELDIVINSAGVFDEYDFQRMFRINVGGVMNSCLLAIERMRRDHGGGGGSVLNLASIAALQPVLAAPLYSATKQSVLTITSSLADDFHHARFGICFHALCPGATNTRFFTDSFDARCLFPDFRPEYHARMKAYPVQEVECVARAALEMIQRGRNGSVVVINDGKISEPPLLPPSSS